MDSETITSWPLVCASCKLSLAGETIIKFVSFKMAAEQFELEWKQQPAENMYPIIKERLDNFNSTWKLTTAELNNLYEEQIKLFDIFHYESGKIKKNEIPVNIAKRKVRFCLNCKMYYKTNSVTKDININLCSTPCHPNETIGCFQKRL